MAFAPNRSSRMSTKESNSPTARSKRFAVERTDCFCPRIFGISVSQYPTSALMQMVFPCWRAVEVNDVRCNRSPFSSCISWNSNVRNCHGNKSMSKCCLAQAPTAVPYDPAASGAIVSSLGRSRPVKASPGWFSVDKGKRGGRGRVFSDKKRF